MVTQVSAALAKPACRLLGAVFGTTGVGTCVAPVSVVVWLQSVFGRLVSVIHTKRILSLSACLVRPSIYRSPSFFSSSAFRSPSLFPASLSPARILAVLRPHFHRHRHALRLVTRAVQLPVQTMSIWYMCRLHPEGTNNFTDAHSPWSRRRSNSRCIPCIYGICVFCICAFCTEKKATVKLDCGVLSPKEAAGSPCKQNP